MNSLRTVGGLNQKYGLIKKPSTSATQLKRLNISAFKDLDADSDNDDSGNSSNINQSLKDKTFRDISRVNREIVSKTSITKDVEKIHSAAINEDASIFDYDGVYDSMKASIVVDHPLSRAVPNDAPKARYINNIRAAASLREKESDRVYERKLLKERQMDGGDIEDQPMFITAAYKEKLIERQKWEYAEKMQAEHDKNHDVKKVGMEGFYANLLTKNVAAGADVSKVALSAFTAGSVHQDELTRKVEPPLPPQLEAEQDEDLVHENFSHEDFRSRHEDTVSNKRAKYEVLDVSAIISNSEATSLQEQHAITTISSENQGSKEHAIMSAKERFLARKMTKAIPDAL